MRNGGASDAGRDSEAVAFIEPDWTPIEVPACLSDLTIDPNSLRARLAELSGHTSAVIDGAPVAIGERASTQGREHARRYLRERYLELGYEVTDHSYGTGTNLIAERAGDDDAFLMVSAHLDAVEGSPGADDDGSGIVTALAIAAALADCPLRHSLRLVAFDEEEEGSFGSAAYAAQVQRAGLDLVLGVLHFEMTAYDSDDDGAYLFVDCDRPDGRFLRDALLSAVGTLGLPLHYRHFCTDASDHQAFWDIGVPAVVMGEFFFNINAPADPNPCYHRTCDTIDDLNFRYMADITTAATLAVAHLVAAP